MVLTRGNGSPCAGGGRSDMVEMVEQALPLLDRMRTTVTGEQFGEMWMTVAGDISLSLFPDIDVLIWLVGESGLPGEPV